MWSPRGIWGGGGTLTIGKLGTVKEYYMSTEAADIK